MASHGVKAWGPPLALAVALIAGGTLMFTALAKPPERGNDATNGLSMPATTSGPTRSTEPGPTTASPKSEPDAVTTTNDPSMVPTDADLMTSTSPSDPVMPPTPSHPATVPSPVDPTVVPPVADSDIDCSKVKCAALTFDDGPDTNTAKILKILKEKDVKATFFVQGYRVKPFAKYLKRAADEGHVIGNHSWDHPYLTKLKKKAVKDQISRTNEAVRKVTGQVPYLVRPPFGAYNDMVKKAVGAPLIMWEVDTRDWADKKGKKILKNIKKELRPGAIIIFHDTAKITAKKLPEVIDYLRKKGYTLVTVPTLLNNTLENGKVYFSRE